LRFLATQATDGGLPPTPLAAGAAVPKIISEAPRAVRAVPKIPGLPSQWSKCTVAAIRLPDGDNSPDSFIVRKGR
jgi:hypothetical protein